MKIEPGMLCEIVDSVSGYNGHLVTTIGLTDLELDMTPDVACWLVELENPESVKLRKGYGWMHGYGKIKVIQSILRPLPPPPLPAMEVEKELVV